MHRQLITLVFGVLLAMQWAHATPGETPKESDPELPTDDCELLARAG